MHAKPGDVRTICECAGRVRVGGGLLLLWSARGSRGDNVNDVTCVTTLVSMGRQLLIPKTSCGKGSYTEMM